MDGHVNLERYWRAFSSDFNKVLGASVLENRGLPILEVNAGYPTMPGQILEIKRFYAARGRPACLILPEGSTLEIDASNAQFVPRAGFAVLEFESERVPEWSPMPSIEQVSWGAARALAQTWCESVGAHGWEVSISNEIARVMPKTSNTLAYIALEADRVIGMGFALDGVVHWLAGDVKTKTAIVKRAAFDAGNPVQFSVNLEQVPQFPLMRELEHYVIWIESSMG
jgi:hypothetical protein